MQNNWALGRILYRFEHWEQAARFFSNACRLSGHGQWCALRACALQHAGKTEQARQASAQAADMPESVWGWLYLAAYRALQGDTDGAVTGLRRHLEINESYNAGYADDLEDYPDFQSLRGDARFEAILKEIRASGGET